MLSLKSYQERTLQSLRLYYRLCRQQQDPAAAFVLATKETLGQSISYAPVQGLAGMPYVCVRIPTGGGKTLVAAHAVGLTARELLHVDDATVLWLVPSNTIREQTLAALRNRAHPYRQALEREAGRVEVLDVQEALATNKSQFEGATVVIVATIQAFRVQDTEGRKVYEDSGALLSHFSELAPELADELERYENGQPLRSLANVLRLRRPVVIVDEAHNSRTELSFGTLARFGPSCILEFTATPNLSDKSDNPPSNVLHTVSAAELTAEEMIKMPLQVVNSRDWRQTVKDAVVARANLEELAKKERNETGEYIRPIALFQAESNRQGRVNVTVEELKKHLMEDHKVLEEELRVATGNKDDLGQEDLNSPNSKVRYILTVQKLREGWDCPFAYVLCSVAESRSSTAVEQLVGRVMRLPRAKRKQEGKLNKAYVFTRSDRLADIIGSLTDALVENGFERQDARDLIVAWDVTESEPGDLFSSDRREESPFEPPTAMIHGFPDVSELPKADRGVCTYDAQTKQLTMTAPMTEPGVQYVIEKLPSEKAREDFKKLQQKAEQLPRKARPLSPAERGDVFEVPWLAVRIGEQADFWEPFEETHLSDVPWSIRDRDPQLMPAEFFYTDLVEEGGEVYFDSGKVRHRYLVEIELQHKKLISPTRVKESDLVWWLDQRIPHRDIDPQDLDIFLLNLVQYLLNRREIPLPDLWLDKYRLLDAVRKRVDEHRRAARAEAFQTFLLPECPTPLTVTPEICFQFGPEFKYPYQRRYAGRYQFHKHYYHVVGDLKDDGEEFECAEFLDQHKDVKFWVRNLVRQENLCFWLQTKSGKFYPDFVAKLTDGRILIVEYKGGDRYTSDESKEKRAVGELWEKHSDGRCLFVMPTRRNWQEIEAKIGQ